MSWDASTDSDEDGPPEAITPDAMTLDEARNTDHIWRILVWSDPGLGKTHFAYSMPEPVCLIDTEGKADAIAHKFDKEVRLWQPTDYDGAREALDQAISFLDWWWDSEGQRGTIAVDSLSVMWRWAQEKHVDENYLGDKDVEDENLTSGFAGETSDWVDIKRYHNKQFRAVMLESDFHLCWTCMSEEDYARKMEEDLSHTPEKPAGEKENQYKATDVVRLRQDGDGATVGDLQKSGLVQHRYSGLPYPTFPKHREMTRTIEEYELDGVPPEEMELPYDARISELPIDSDE